MSSVIQKLVNIMSSSFSNSSLLAGISNIVLVKWNNGHFRSTPFLVNFGPWAAAHPHSKIRVKVNGNLVDDVQFSLDQYGYVHPMRPSQVVLAQINKLADYGKNLIEFGVEGSNYGKQANGYWMAAQIYLYGEEDKILVSDVDGTLTKDDLGGLYSNIYGSHYLHDGYYQLIEALDNHNIKILWLTMRSLPLYQFSKPYIKTHTKIQGPLLTQPQPFLPAISKYLLRKTSSIKTNMLKTIRELFPQYASPFVGGLGNRDGDAVAYLAAGIQLDRIFIVDTVSEVHCLGNSANGVHHKISYHEMSTNLMRYFGEIGKFKKGYSMGSMTNIQSKRDSGYSNYVKKYQSYQNIL